jgi:hypothetical protein
LQQNAEEAVDGAHAASLPIDPPAGKETSSARRPGKIPLCRTRRRCYRRRMSRLALAACLLLALAVAAAADDLGGVNAAGNDAVQALQQRIVSDPDMAASVQALRDDPQVQAVLADPKISAALASGDLSALLNDPKIRDLADDPAVQDITRKVAR